MENQNTLTTKNDEQQIISEEKTKKSPKKTIKIILFSILAIAPIALTVWLVLLGGNMLPKKTEAQRAARNRIESYIETANGSSLVDIEFTSCKYKLFIDESKDEFGFFEYCLNTQLQSGEKQYENYIEYYKKEYNLDVYGTPKYGYTMEGICKIKDKNGNVSEREFNIIVIQVWTNLWMSFINEESFEPEQDIEIIVENDIRVYAKLTYKDMKNCRVEITDIEEEQGTIGNKVVYGKVYITDHYGDKYKSRFKATYDYNYGSLSYNEPEIEMDTPTQYR